MMYAVCVRVELIGVDVQPKLQRLSVHSRLGSQLTTSDTGETSAPHKLVRYVDCFCDCHISR